MGSPVVAGWVFTTGQGWPLAPVTGAAAAKGMGTLRGEALLAVTGITAALRPGPMSITVKILGKAKGIEATIRRGVRRFVREKTLADPPDIEPFDFQEIADLLPHAQDEARQVENVSGFYDPQLALEYAEALGSALGYIQSIAPMEMMPALIGSGNMAPGGLDMGEFQWRYQVVDNALSVLDKLAAGILTPDEVEALEMAFPQLYGLMRTALEQELIAGGKSLGYEKDQAMMVFLQSDIVDPRLHVELINTFEAAREKESGQTSQGQPTGRAPVKGIGDVATQQEHLEAK